MINTITVEGNLVAEPETRQVAQTAVTKFRIACNRNYKNKQTGKYDADYFTVEAWGARSNYIKQYAMKGSHVIVTGELTTSRVQDQQTGKNITYYTIRAANTSLVGGRSNQQQGGFNQAPQGNGYGQPQGGFNQAPQNNGYGQNNNYGNNNFNNRQGGFNRAPQGNGYGQPQQSNPSPQGFGQPQQPQGGFNQAPQNSGNDINVSDDDLPF